MLGQPVSMLIPEVVGFKLHGKLPPGATATDLVLTVTEMLRKKKVVGKFVEFYGTGLTSLPLADRATIANMAPEYGATMGFFPVDEETLKYLRLSGRPRASRQARRGVHQGAGPLPHRRDARSACSPTRSSSTSAPWSRASPDRSVRRIACRSRSRRRCTARRSTPISRSSDGDAARTRQRSRPTHRPARSPSPRRTTQRRRREGGVQRPVVHAAPRRRRDRGDHELHEHVESGGDARGGPARAKRGEEGPQDASRG